ncbi:MAG: hypothetical protein BAJALOKI3v1_310009 [Promethearchaeota archaeon]|jgi:predicted CopG family antitoxin|nr:MAG: hypothetical protein BAJALOKI3v1_310009 [Candidatus Lokiarchaeota archaeon]
MNTSIQISKNTLKKLKQLKKVYNSPTYDDLINDLIKKAENVPDSMFGVDKGKLKKFSREDRIAFREY